MSNTGELIDKQRLMEWLKAKANTNHSGTVHAALMKVFKEIQSGTFDDHSAQEKGATVDQLKQYIECRNERDEWKAKAIQAEQERDDLKRQYENLMKRKRALEKFAPEGYFFKGDEMEPDENERLSEERNALLEGLKSIAKAPTYGDAKLLVDKARSIIAKIEGREPDERS